MIVRLSRLSASIIHLGASIFIFLIFLSMMLLAWYPAPYFEVDGGWTVLQILVGVDLVLGPVLTLIVFKPGKPGLKFDLTCIVLMQLGALAYGGATIYQQRPTFVVFTIDRFTTIPASAIDPAKLRYPQLQPRILQIGPRLAQARLPEDPKAREELMFAIVAGGQKDIEFRAEFYEPYQPDLKELRARSIDLQTIADHDAQAKTAVERFLTRQNSQLKDYLYLPLKGNNKDIVFVLSPQDGQPAGFISISPWMEDYRHSKTRT